MSGDRIYSRRTVACFFILTLLFFSCALRVFKIATGNYAEICDAQNSYTIKLSALRGTIYDCNMEKITNTKKQTVAIISPTAEAIIGVKNLVGEAKYKTVLESLKSKKPTYAVVDKKIKCNGIYYTDILVNQDFSTSAIHTVGYLDDLGHGKTGLQYAYDSELYIDEDVTVNFKTSGKGKILEGVTPIIQNNTKKAENGIVATLDKNIQTIAETHSKNITSGAIIIAETKTNKIRAAVSTPWFDCKDIANYLKSENSTLKNKILGAYNVGSVFKPCIAAAGIENGYQNFTNNCVGQTQIVDRVFNCHEREGHGELDLCHALALSCNTFFYNFGISVGGNVILNKAQSLGFGTLSNINRLSLDKGILPNGKNLENPALLANFSIGQGELLASPVVMLNLYSAIANGGQYKNPSIIEGVIKDGELKQEENGGYIYAMKKSTADIIKQGLCLVLSEGTGKLATPKSVTAAGKTATAQTGRYNGDTEICESWFCGFFPAESPEYTVIVFSENNLKQKKSCGEIFAEIANSIVDSNLLNQ